MKKLLRMLASGVAGVVAYVAARELFPDLAGHAEAFVAVLWLALLAVYATLRQRIEDLSMDLGMVEMVLADKFPDEFSTSHRFRSGD